MQSNQDKIDYGSNQYYNNYKKNIENPVDSKTFRDVVKEIHDLLIDEIILENYLFRIPYLGLRIFITKQKQKVFLKGDRVINTSLPDWETTKKLWEVDPEAKEKKIVVKYVNSHTNKYIFKISMDKIVSGLGDRMYYRFTPSRSFKRYLAKKINNGDLDLNNVYIKLKNGNKR